VPVQPPPVPLDDDADEEDADDELDCALEELATLDEELADEDDAPPLPPPVPPAPPALLLLPPVLPPVDAVEDEALPPPPSPPPPLVAVEDGPEVVVAEVATRDDDVMPLLRLEDEALPPPPDCAAVSASQSGSLPTVQKYELQPIWLAARHTAPTAPNSRIVFMLKSLLPSLGPNKRSARGF